MNFELPSPKSTKPMLRKGRGSGSNKGGHTAGRGGKGQTARTGHNSPRPAFEGGQNPLARRIPMLRGLSKKSSRGSRRPFDLASDSFIVKLSDIEKAGLVQVNIDTLIGAGLIKPSAKTFTVKLLGGTAISSKLEVSEVDLSKSAKEAVQQAGGSVLE